MESQVELMLANLQANLKKDVKDRICFENLSVDLKSIDRRRIIEENETKLLEMISDSNFTV